MRPRLALLLLAALVVPPLAAVEAQGRPTRVAGLQALDFGDVLAGVANTVPRTDPLRTGQFELRGEKQVEMQVTFGLPPQMTGPGGATLALEFGSDDAGYSPSESIAAQVGFDPRLPYSLRLPNNGKSRLFLGGLVRPSASQRGGDYTATVVLTVANLGI